MSAANGQRFAAQVVISDYLSQDAIAFALQALRRDVALELFEFIYRHNGPVTIKVTEGERDADYYQRAFWIHVDAVPVQHMTVTHFDYVAPSIIRKETTWLTRFWQRLFH